MSLVLDFGVRELERWEQRTLELLRCVMFEDIISAAKVAGDMQEDGELEAASDLLGRMSRVLENIS